MHVAELMNHMIISHDDHHDDDHDHFDFQFREKS